MIKIAASAAERVLQGESGLRDAVDLYDEFIRLDRLRVERGLSVAELERWTGLLRLLEARSSKGRGIHAVERRRSPRVPTRLTCSFDSLGLFEQALITNMSRGGVFLRTKTPLPVGTKLKLRIRVEPNTDLEVESEVVSNDVGPALGAARRGMGLRFTETDPELVGQIDDLCRRALAQAGDDPDA